MDLIGAWLPTVFITEIEKFEKEGNKFVTVLRSGFQSESKWEEWLGEFSQRSHSSWIVRRTHPKLTNLLFRKDFCCHHSCVNKKQEDERKRDDSTRNMNTMCKATMNIKIKRDTTDIRKRDAYAKRGLLASIIVNWEHNHDLNNAASLSYRRIALNVREQFLEYIRQGLHPPAAMEACRNELELQGCDESTMADASINPKSSSIYPLFEKWRLENLGGRDRLSVLLWLEKNSAQLSSNGTTVMHKEEPFAVAIVTPIMRRSHALQSASEICFVDSTASCDTEQHAVTFLMVKSSISAVPVGVLITASQSQESYVSGFSLLKEAFGSYGFNQQRFPSIIMTDDSDAERNALASVWPNSKALLCQFHCAQAAWRWLFDTWNCIAKVSEDGCDFESGVFKVPSESQPNVFYVVDTNSGSCTCAVGTQGRCCKHQLGAWKFFKAALPNIPPISAASRHEAAVLALGDSAPYLSFYQPLRSAAKESGSFTAIEAISPNAASSEGEGMEVGPCQNPPEPPTNCEVLEDLFTSLRSALQNFDDGSSNISSGLERILRRSRKIENSNQLASFLHSSGLSIPLKRNSRKAIRVQPTALSRRPVGVGRGSKAIAKGRRARKHCLSANIEKNCPNAKQH